MRRKYNNYTGDDLTFVVCAYKECGYLDECVNSLLDQTVKARVVISTSTPNQHIAEISRKYRLKVLINPNGGQINDYNYAIECADTPLVMLAHQDDVLERTFVERVLNELNYTFDPIIAFTDYKEIHNDEPDESQSKIIKIKKLLLLPSKFRWLMKRRLGKRLIQLFGNPITHPTVVCVKNKLPERVFREDFKASMDWDLWERLSNTKGSFVYVDNVLLHHRMNEDNQSSLLIRSTTDRYDNEYDIMCRFWPKPIARIIMHFYEKAHSYY